MEGTREFFFYEIYHENSPRDEEGEHMMEVMESNKFCGLSGLELFIGPKYGSCGHGRGYKLVRWKVGIKEWAVQKISFRLT